MKFVGLGRKSRVFRCELRGEGYFLEDAGGSEGRGRILIKDGKRNLQCGVGNDLMEGWRD